MKKGSAIIIALLLVSAAASITLGLGRISGLENVSSAAYANGASAYYAAESGIEEAFLRYRYNQSAEIPAANWTIGGTEVYRSNMANNSVTTGTNYVGISKTTPVDAGLFGSQIYDLRLGSQSSSFGLAVSDLTSTICSNKEHINCLPRDESKKFKVDFSNQDIRDINLMFLPNGGNGAGFTDDKCLLIELKVVGKTVGGEISERKMIFYNSDAACSSHNQTILAAMASGGDGSYLPFDSYLVGGTIRYRIENIKNKVYPTVTLTDSELYIKSIGASIAFTLAPKSDSPTVFYGPTLDIESTGYFGGTSRKLTSNIDRQSGTLYDLFDYVVYQAN